MYLKNLRPTAILKFLFFFLVFQQLHFSGAAQMRKMFHDPAEPENEIYKISFYSPSAGYVAFRDFVGFTLDSGRTFTKKYIAISNVDFNGNTVNLTFGFGINGVKAFDQNTILVYGDYGLVPAILRSTNGGNNFKLVYHSQYDPLQLRNGITDMVFPENGNIGFAVDADRILKTANQGVTWNPVRNDPGSYFDHLESTDNNTIFAISKGWDKNKLLRSSNGNSFQPVTLPAGQSINSLSFLTPTTGWINTRDKDNIGSTYYTTNGGINWILKNDPYVTSFNTSKMKFVNDSTGYALSGLFGVYKTTDAGKIWERLSRDNSISYLGYSHNDLHVANVNKLWAGGGYGLLELSTNGGGEPIPASHFRIDTTGFLQTGVVKLVNYSKHRF